MPVRRKRSTTSRKRKAKVKVSQKAELRKKDTINSKTDSVPIKQYIPDNAVTFKIKIKRKR